MANKNRLKLIVTYNNQQTPFVSPSKTVRLFQTDHAPKSELAAFSRLFDRCSYMQGYSGLNKILDFYSHEGLADDIIEIGLALGIPVKYIPEHKKNKEVKEHG